MPEISPFYGIIIRMFAEPGAPHHRPHFHAYFQNQVGIYAIDAIERIAAGLQQTQERLVEAWAELHQAELLENWNRLQAGKRPLRIAPLR